MMHDFIMAEDSELWNVICDGPFGPMKTIREPEVSVPKTRKEYNDANRKVIEKTSEPKRSSSVVLDQTNITEFLPANLPRRSGRLSKLHTKGLLKSNSRRLIC